MSTPLTPDQYGELVRALELMNSRYAAGCPHQPQQMLRDMWQQQAVSAWAFIYLIEWFGKVGQDSAHIPYMVAELCVERT